MSLGYVVGQEGAIGGELGRFACLDSEQYAGTMIEISDISGAKGEYFRHIHEVATGWDGSDPIREVG